MKMLCLGWLIYESQPIVFTLIVKCGSLGRPKLEVKIAEDAKSKLHFSSTYIFYYYVSAQEKFFMFPFPFKVFIVEVVQQIL